MARRCAGGILLEGRRILLGKRAADLNFYPDVWDIVGGHCEPGEQPEETLVREMQEEVGVVPRAFTRQAILPEPAPDLYGEGEYHVFAVTEWEGCPVALGSEHAEIRWFELGEAMELDLAHPEYRCIFAALAGGSSSGAA